MKNINRMHWWKRAKFGMFIHWGLYSIPGGEWKDKKIKGYGEKIMYFARIHKKDYAKLAKKFNPINYDARKWVKIAKESGMKYLIITAKHHDGFCLFDSKLTKYNVVKATPYKKDIVKTLADACSEFGVKFGVYYSILDWNKSSSISHNLAYYQNFPEYLAYLKGQIKELLTNYGKIAVLWFDGDWIPQWNNKIGTEIENYCRNIYPEIIINNRVGKRPFWVLPHMPGFMFSSTKHGDFDTPEQMIPTRFPQRNWETNMSMNNTFGYKKWDNNWKSAETLINYMKNIFANNGNFLLNVGPDETGKIPKHSHNTLKEIGYWTRTEGKKYFQLTQ